MMHDRELRRRGGEEPPDGSTLWRLWGMFVIVAGWVVAVCGALSASLSTGYVHSALASDGLTALDVVLMLLAGAAFWGFLSVLYFVGLRVLPELRGPARTRGVRAWLAGTLAVIAVSFPTGLLYMGEPLASGADFRDAVNRGLVQAAETVETARNVPALIPVARNGHETAATMAQRERQFGPISGDGGGTGPTTDALETVATLLGSTENALVRARSTAAPLVRRIEALSAKVRRVADAPNLDAAQKRAQAKGYLVELGQVVIALRRTAPVEQIEAARDGLLKDWWSIGLSDRAASTLEGTFSPLGGQFNQALAELLAEADRELDRYVEKHGFDLIASRTQEILPIAVFVLLLDLLPVLIVTLLLILTRQDEDDDTAGGNPSAVAVPSTQQLTGPDHRRGRKNRRGGRRLH